MAAAPAWTGAFLLLMSGAFAWGVDEYSRGAIAAFFVLGAAALIGRRLWWRRNLPDALGRGALEAPGLALVCGAPEDALRLRPSLERQGYQMARTIVAPDGKLEAAAEALRGQAIDDIFLVPAEGLALDMQAAAWVLRALPIPVALVPDPALAALAAKPRHQIGKTLALEIQREPFSLEERVAKRALDLVVAGAALVALAADGAHRLGDPAGKSGAHSFPANARRLQRSSVPDHQVPFHARSRGRSGGEAGPSPGSPGHPRAGAVLRRTSLDELPQIVQRAARRNTLVGPRPHAMKHDGEFGRAWRTTPSASTSRRA